MLGLKDVGKAMFRNSDTEDFRCRFFLILALRIILVLNANTLVFFKYWQWSLCVILRRRVHELIRCLQD